MSMEIEVITPVICRTKRKYGELILPALSCTAEYYRAEHIPGTDKTRQVRYEYEKHFFPKKTHNYWYFYNGHLERVQQFLEDLGLEPAEIFGFQNGITPKTPNLPGITFRPDQIELMNYALQDETGVILSPTGSGKTILQLGIMSAYPSQKIVLLAHTIDIIQQTVEELLKFGFEGVQQIGGGKRFKGEFDRIVVSTVQSFQKIDPTLYENYFDVLMVDEAHRVSSLDSTYAKVLRNILATIRLGFTATEPSAEYAKMTLEGLIGPVIGELSIEEASELGILAKPRVKLLKSEFSHRIKDTRRYADVYQVGVVENEDRNNMIAHKVMEHHKINDVTLIFVNRIEHGELLQKKFEGFGQNVPFIRGDMAANQRLNVKHSLIERRTKIAIATTAWREGVNIPSLDVIFNAGGGKDELGVIQLIGRGLRKDHGKEEVVIYDIFDPSHYFLISHFGERITLYMENEWL